MSKPRFDLDDAALWAVTIAMPVLAVALAPAIAVSV